MQEATQDKKPARRKRLTKEEIGRMTLAEYIEYRCYDRRSTLAYFRECGLTYDKNGTPVVVPK